MAALHLTAWLGDGRLPRGATDWPAELLERAPRLARFDAGHYRVIATTGYRAPAGEGTTRFAFFPLYPLLMGAGARATRLEPLWVGSALSHLSFFLAAFLLLRHFERAWGREHGEAAFRAFLAFPWAFFLLAVYSEALFLCLALLALEAAAARRPALAAAGGFLGGLTRIGALALVPAWLWRWRRGGGEERWPAAVALAPLAGVAAWWGWLTWATGDPLAFVRSQQAGWARPPGDPLATLAEPLRIAGRHLAAGELLRLGAVLDLLVLALLAAVLVWHARRRRTFEALWVAGAVGLVLVSGGLASIGRYALVVVPLFPALAALRTRPLLWRAWLLASALLQAYLIVRFVNHQWVA